MRGSASAGVAVSHPLQEAPTVHTHRVTGLWRKCRPFVRPSHCMQCEPLQGGLAYTPPSTPVRREFSIAPAGWREGRRRSTEVSLEVWRGGPFALRCRLVITTMQATQGMQQKGTNAAQQARCQRSRPIARMMAMTRTTRHFARHAANGCLLTLVEPTCHYPSLEE